MGLHPVLRCCDVRRKPYFLYAAVSHFANTEQSYSMHYFFIRPLQCSMKYSTCKTLQLCKTLLVETSSYEFIFYNTRRSKGPNPHCRYYNRLLSCFWKPCTNCLPLLLFQSTFCHWEQFSSRAPTTNCSPPNQMLFNQQRPEQSIVGLF